jgi:hypothetical protein
VLPHDPELDSLARRPSSIHDMDPAVRDAAVAYLRDWLPADARRVYRGMIEDDPEHWHRDAHFAGGVVVDHLLRGNGLDERALGVRDLDGVWPELLRLAVEEE